MRAPALAPALAQALAPALALLLGCPSPLHPGPTLGSSGAAPPAQRPDCSRYDCKLLVRMAFGDLASPRCYAYDAEAGAWTGDPPEPVLACGEDEAWSGSCAMVVASDDVLGARTDCGCAAPSSSPEWAQCCYAADSERRAPPELAEAFAANYRADAESLTAEIARDCGWIESQIEAECLLRPGEPRYAGLDEACAGG